MGPLTYLLAFPNDGGGFNRGKPRPARVSAPFRP